MSFENLAKDPAFVLGLSLLNNVESKKFVRLVDRIMKDFEPNQLHSFTEHELLSMKKSLKLNNDQCLCLLNSLNRLLKQVIGDVTKPSILKNVLYEVFSFDMEKVAIFCECWTTNAEQVVSRLQQNFTQSYKLKDINWALNISSNVGTEISNPEPRCLIELKVEDYQFHDELKTKEIILDLNNIELEKFNDILETIKTKIDLLPEQ